MATNSKSQAWFCSTGLPSDVVVEVDNMAFHLHKFPLMAKSKKLHELITEQEGKSSSSSQEEENDDDQEVAGAGGGRRRYNHLSFPGFPGGPGAFEMAAKFCYTVKFEFTSSNVVQLRCAGEVLEMSEDYCENNLVSEAERFLSQTVFQSLQDSIETLKSCDHLMPLADSLGVVDRCIESILTELAALDPAGLFGWPLNDDHPTTPRVAGKTDWLDQITYISPRLFIRLITTMKCHNNINPQMIETCILGYAKKHIPGIIRTNRKPIPIPSSKPSEILINQKDLLETIVSTFPEKETICSSSSTTAVKLYFGMLRISNILNTTDECKSILEKKIGSQFEHATLDDLLMPSYSYLTETLYDVDCVRRILEYFLQSLEDDHHKQAASLVLVGKLMDGYLSEIALDANLKPEKFYELAIALPEQARIYDDGLYRSVDVFIKAHPWITESDREKVSGVLDCRKLTLEACTHAAQNERLPLRAVVQVLFFEQLQLRQAIAGTLMATEMGPSDSDKSPAGTRRQQQRQDEMVVVGDDGTWRAAVRENQVLRLGMDSMKRRVHELERECTTIKTAIEKIDKAAQPAGWFTRKLGCTFKTQVCDSHEPPIVETRKGRTRRTRRDVNDKKKVV